jgi:hypothetical protein
MQWIGHWLPRSLTSAERLAWFPGQPDARRKLSAFLQGQILFNHPYFVVRGLFPLIEVTELLQTEVNEMLFRKMNYRLGIGWESEIRVPTV